VERQDASENQEKIGKFTEGLTDFALKGGIFHRRMKLDALSSSKAAPEADRHLLVLEVPCPFFAARPRHDLGKRGVQETIPFRGLTAE
jgi:hypothetical protein